MICPNCHNENREGARFCDSCGHSLENVSCSDEALVSGSTEQPSLDAQIPSVVSSLPEISLDSRGETQEIPALEDSSPDVSDSSEVSDVESESQDESTNDVESSKDSLDEAPEETSESDNSSEPDSSSDKTQVIFDPDTTGVIGERLVDSDFVAPKPDWRDGATMEMPVIDGSSQEKSRDFRASATKDKKHSGRKVVIVVVVLALIAAAVAAGVTYSMEIWGGKTLPDVTGMSQSEATKVLEERGFSVKTTQVKSDSTEGLVVVEDPEGNTRQAEGSEVVIHISFKRSIPDIVGKNINEAQKLINAEDLNNVTYTQVNSDEPEGTILSVSPEAGTSVKGQTAVEVKVAQPYTVPDTSSMTLSQAEQAINDAGLTYQIYYTYSEQYADYTLLGTSPAAGEKVTSDTVVVLNVTRVRSAELIAATQNYLVAGSTITISGMNYTISSLDSVDYLGNNQTSFSMVATASYLFLTGSPATYTGTISWNDDNSIASIVLSES